MTLTPPCEAKEVPAPEGEALGVWLSLDQLRALPLPSEAKADLLRALLDAPEADRIRLTLQGELAELNLLQCEQAYRSQQWPEALRLHDELLVLVRSLTAAMPELAEQFWTRYGLCLAFLAAAVHEGVILSKPEPVPHPLRLQLCWETSQRLEQAASLPWTPPDWLDVVEQQLVECGAVGWREVVAEASGDASASALPKALSLAMRLHGLLQPPPDWVTQMARELLERQVESSLDSPALDPEAMAELLDVLERWPVRDDQQAAMDAALLRARMALGLLAPESSPPQNSRDDQAPSPPAPQRASAEEGAIAEMVWSADGEEVGPLQLDLRPLLTMDAADVNAALDDFIWDLPKGCLAEPATAAIVAALEPQWHQGLRLPAAAFGRLAVLAATWQRRFGERVQPLPPLDWQFNLVVELAPTELATLTLLLESPDALLEAMTQLRREHHNRAFWQRRQEVPWIELPPAVEVLRRLHVEEGFYASGHDPLQDLRHWGEEVLRGLGGSELWTDDAGCLGLWLRVAEQMVQQTSSPLPLLGRPPDPQTILEALAGAEVVYVGDQAAAVHAAHREGRCFRGGAFGLRVLDTPASHWPARPATSFALSQATLLERLDGLYRERPFAVLLADCGAYRLPLLQAAQQRYGISGFSTGLPMARWLGVE